MPGNLTECPVCHKVYYTKLKRKTDKLIQEEFPYEKPIYREQLISGICSDTCWDKIGLI